MADNQLSAVAGAGEQAATQNPQSVPVANGLAGPAASNIQSGSANSLQGGTQLNNNSLSSGIKLNVAGTGTATQSGTTAVLPVLKPQHHLNPVLLIVPGVLIVLACALAWFMTRSAKNTTDYS